MAFRSGSDSKEVSEVRTTPFSQENQSHLAASGTSGTTLDPKPRKHDPDVLFEQLQLVHSLDDQDREDLSKQLALTWHLNKAFKGGRSSNHDEDESESELEESNGKNLEESVQTAQMETETNGNLPDNTAKNQPKPISVPAYRHWWRAWPLPVQQTPLQDDNMIAFDSLKECLIAMMLHQASVQMSKRNCKEDLFADDELSSTICTPAVEEILARFDQLLVSLYKSREGYAADSTLQDIRPMFRKRKYRKSAQNQEESTEEDSSSDDISKIDHNDETPSPPTKRQKTGAEQPRNTITQAYKQGSQRLLSEADVIQHALIQSFPRGVLRRASERLDKILQPGEADPHSRNQIITLLEAKDDCLKLRGLAGKLDDSSRMASMNKAFLETDTEKLAIGEEWVNRSMWQAWVEQKKQQSESGCFDRDGFLEEIPGHGLSAGRRRKYQERKRKEMDIKYG